MRPAVRNIALNSAAAAVLLADTGTIWIGDHLRADLDKLSHDTAVEDVEIIYTTSGSDPSVQVPSWSLQPPVTWPAQADVRYYTDESEQPDLCGYTVTFTAFLSRRSAGPLIADRLQPNRRHGTAH